MGGNGVGNQEREAPLFQEEDDDDQNAQGRIRNRLRTHIGDNGEGDKADEKTRREHGEAQGQTLKEEKTSEGRGEIGEEGEKPEKAREKMREGRGEIPQGRGGIPQGRGGIREGREEYERVGPGRRQLQPRIRNLAECEGPAPWTSASRLLRLLPFDS